MFTQQPQDQTVCEGDNVTITCGFLGGNVRPNWIIGNMTLGTRDIMSNDRLYVPEVSNTSDTVLIILSVPLSMNGTGTQCEVPTLTVEYSVVGVLTVIGEALTNNNEYIRNLPTFELLTLYDSSYCFYNH